MHTRVSLSGLFATAAMVIGTLACVAATGTQRPTLAPFVPTPQDVVDRMLKLANVTKDDVVYDLGSGDGRIVITAARTYGARGVGIDIDRERIRESRANARRAGVEHLVQFTQGDILQADVSPATVVTLYLVSSANLKLRPLLTKQLRPGSRIVSHAFGMGDWAPVQTDRFKDSQGDDRVIYLWRTDGDSHDQ
jgi:SAM-dependent methyltransferase